MRKNMLDVTIKDVDRGEIEAIFSRFDVIDLDGDVTRKGAFTEGQPVVISAYGHKSWEGALPIGKGTIHEVGDVAVMKGRFFLNTNHGRDAWETVKELSAAGLQEWSYSLHDVVAKSDTVEGRKVRVIEKVKLVKEVSPVLIGAGIDTATLSTKQLASHSRQSLTTAARERWGDENTWVYVDDYDPEAMFAIVQVETEDASALYEVSYTATDNGAVTLADDVTEVVRTVSYARKGKFSEQTDVALVAVGQLVQMAEERLTLRAAEGKSVSEQIDAYRRLVDELSPLKSAIDAITTPTPDAEALREFARFVALSQGVTPS